MKALLFVLSAARELADGLVRELDLETGEIERRQFPDGESYVRLAADVKSRDVVLLCSLDRPNAKALPLLFVADAARTQGARSVGLVAPYLAYMRQDKAFKPGEAITSLTFSRLLSAQFDWLVTLDPHLHRHPSLDSIYSVPTVAASAVVPIAQWIRDNIEHPFLVGPDVESTQWVTDIASIADAPFTVFSKKRTGDYEVTVRETEGRIAAGATPVVVDDVASSARTLVEAVHLLRQQAGAAPYCVVVHPLFAGDAYEQLLKAGPAGVASTNTVKHSSNCIDVSGPLACAIQQALNSR